MIAADLALALALKEKHRRAKLRENDPQHDPMRRLMDPTFETAMWVYEHSRIGDEVPGNMHPKQVEALFRPEKHRWLFWGNQAGKTTFSVWDCVLTALGRHPMQYTPNPLSKTGAMMEPMPGCTIWASALSWDLWENVLLPEFLTWIPRDRIVGKPPEPFKPGANREIRVRADNGKISRIIGKSAEQGAAKYQSARVNKILLDEEHPWEIWNEMLPRLVRFGGRTIGAMTPLLGLTWIYEQIYMPVENGNESTRKRHWFSHAGMADNPAIPRESIEDITAELAHNPARLASRLFGKFAKPEGTIYDWDTNENEVELTPEQTRALIRDGNIYGGVDFGDNRFAFGFGAVDREGTLTMIEEHFSQRESYKQRAKDIHHILSAVYKLDVPDQFGNVKHVTIWGDCAVPDELEELNNEFAALGAPWYVLPVEMKNKSIANGVARVQSLVRARRLKMRRGMGGGKTWYLRKTSNSNGVPVHTSRWLYEMNNWCYETAKDGKTQSDKPDDTTADGADMMDWTRYLALQWLGPLPEVPASANVSRTREEILAAEFEQYRHDEQRHETADPHVYGTVLRQ